MRKPYDPARRRENYKRWLSTNHAGSAQRLVPPDDVERFEGDGSPCFKCEAPRGCRHRPWMLAS